MLKGNHCSESIERTSNNTKNFVASFATRAEGFKGGVVKIAQQTLHENEPGE